MTTPITASASYFKHVARLERRLTTDDELRRAVGGEFTAIGKLEYFLLRSRGLKDNDLVVDVGCGSGRLACQLAPFPGIRYIGCDVVPRLLEYAGAALRATGLDLQGHRRRHDSDKARVGALNGM